MNATTEAMALIIASITAAGLIWRKVVIPVRNFIHTLKAWMKRIEASVTLVEEQMKPNGGATLYDKAEQASAERMQMRAEIAELSADVRMLLLHDRERDTPGFRYGPATGGD